MGKTHSPMQNGQKSATLNEGSDTTNTGNEKISLVSKILLLPIYFYRYFISPLIGPRCRFYPSCSTYAVEAIKIHGAIKGGYLAFKRILRCNPLNEGGEILCQQKRVVKNVKKIINFLKFGELSFFQRVYYYDHYL